MTISEKTSVRDLEDEEKQKIWTIKMNLVRRKLGRVVNFTNKCASPRRLPPNATTTALTYTMNVKTLLQCDRTTYTDFQPELREAYRINHRITDKMSLFYTCFRLV